MWEMLKVSEYILVWLYIWSEGSKVGLEIDAVIEQICNLRESVFPVDMNELSQLVTDCNMNVVTVIGGEVSCVCEGLFSNTNTVFTN